ncbi:MAG: LacI family transcriptional regulator [Calditrichales bacterium]|nr:MAG: LacI family transcriptional regulator [Calditrichales bacterium]
MAAILKDVAKLAQVHTSTVSRVLRGNEDLRIPEETRKKIFAAAKKLNYQPDQTARSLRMKKSFTIGLIVPDITNPFFARIARSIETCSFDTGYTVIVCNSGEDQKKEIHLMNELLSRQIDGLIIAPVQDSIEHLRVLKEKNFPFVLIDRFFDEMETNAVVSNNEESAYEAVVYFSKLGHKRIAMIKGRKSIYTIKKRLQGYERAMIEINNHVDPELMVGDGFRLEDGYDAAMNVLKLEPRPTALLVSGNLVTVGVFKAIMEMGLSIPDDISLIAYADNVFSPYLVVPLTTVSHQLDEIGNRAFGLLKVHMEAKEPIPLSKIVIQSNFEIRGSVKKIN